MSLKKKVVWLPYDMDTAIGINNDGELVFDYQLEDIDHQQGGEPIFNGQDSVIWKNIRAAFSNELQTMYRNLRSTGALSYAKVEQMFEEHQGKWAEAIYNEDAQFKYILPFINDNANYLYMLLGSKAEQRKWWLYNRFRYIDSKYIAGDARTDTIFLRPYAVDDITITPYADIYATVAWDATITQERASRGSSVTLECPYQSMNGNIVIVYSSSQLASIGDLSGLKVGQIDISNATRLQSLKVGDSDPSYSNSNLYSITFGSNVLMQTIDLRNCTGLGDTTMQGHTQTTVDISGCSIIENAYFDGTKITGITLPNGGVLKKLHLPATISNLTILNQGAITEFVMPSYDNVSTLRLENVSSAIDSKTILNTIANNPNVVNPRIRIMGFAWEAEDAEEISEIFDELDNMRGLDQNGNNLDNCRESVSGTIHAPSLTGDDLADFNARYPHITVTATNLLTYLTYKTWDGSSTVSTVECLNGVPQSASPTIPSRADSADGHYSYTAVGWNTSMDATTNDSSCITNVTTNRTVYAAYTPIVKTYTVLWKNSNGTTLETDNNVAWGTVPTYNGATPVDPSGQGSPFVTWTPTIVAITGNTTYTATYKPVWTVTFKSQDGATTLQTKQVIDGNTASYTGTTPTNPDQTTFLGWSNSMNSSNADAVLTNIQANKTVYAAFESLVEDIEITDTWDQIIANIDNGTYSTAYKLGNYKPLDLGSTYGTVNMQIVAFDSDVATAGGTAPITFVAKELLLQKSMMNYNAPSNAWVDNNTLRPLLNNTILPLIPSNIRNRMVVVNKTCYDYSQSTNVSVEKLWIPSFREMCGSGGAREDSGVIYDTIFKNDSDKIKIITGETSATAYWLRTGDKNSSFKSVAIKSNGDYNWYYPGDTKGICIGFCLGYSYPTPTITDTWSEIFAAESDGTYSTKYSVGDTAVAVIDNRPYLMQIVAMDSDVRADGDTTINNGKAKISWLMKDLLSATYQKMNDTSTNTNGWAATLMRSWLRDTILPTIDSTIRSNIVEVNKTYYDKTSSSTKTQVDTVWIPSAKEMTGGTSYYESSGVDYTELFSSNTARIKKIDGIAASYWLRTAYSNNVFRFRNIHTNGDIDSNNADNRYGVCIGFCT